MDDDQPNDVQLAAVNIGVDGEHGPLFQGIDLEFGPGLHAVQMPAGRDQDALLLTLAGRLKPNHGTVNALGATTPGAIRKKCAIAAFEDIDDLDESVTVETVLAEARRRGLHRVDTRASHVARTTFERTGFVVDRADDRNTVRGVLVPNLAMHVDL